MGRNALTFFVFLLISTVFWFLMALNDEVQRDFRVPVALVDFPENVTIISGATASVNVTVKDKESSLMKFAWGGRPLLRLHYDEFLKSGEHSLVFSVNQLNSAVRGVFGPTATILAVRPDSLRLEYTENPGVRTRVRMDVDAHTQPQCVRYGAITMSPDSVMLFSNSNELYAVGELRTAPVVLRDLADTTVVEARLVVPEGMRAIPSTVRLTIPVEPLVSKTRRVELQVADAPSGHRLVPFPSVVEVSFLMPKSLYNKENTQVRAFVEYPSSGPAGVSAVPGSGMVAKDAGSADAAVIPVQVGVMPPYYRNVQVTPSSVEYVIERD